MASGGLYFCYSSGHTPTWAKLCIFRRLSSNMTASCMYITQDVLFSNEKYGTLSIYAPSWDRTGASSECLLEFDTSSNPLGHHGQIAFCFIPCALFALQNLFMFLKLSLTGFRLLKWISDYFSNKKKVECLRQKNYRIFLTFQLIFCSNR